MKIRIYVKRRDGVLDPEAKTVQNTLNEMGYVQIKDLQKGSFLDIELMSIPNDLDSFVGDICKKLLVNEIIESYNYELL
jgi:phosphoribosylformylglycinamidine synthase